MNKLQNAHSKKVSIARTKLMRLNVTTSKRVSKNIPVNTSLVSAYPVVEFFEHSEKNSIGTDNCLYEKKEDTYFIKKPLSFDDIIKLAKEVLAETINHAQEITSPELMRDYLALQLACHERELFGVAFLNTKYRPIAFEILSYGTLSEAKIYPREVIKRTIANNAAAIILVHNHPSSCVKPSYSDICITRKIKNALSLIDVSLVDHFIVGNGQSCSLSERGEL